MILFLKITILVLLGAVLNSCTRENSDSKISIQLPKNTALLSLQASVSLGDDDPWSGSVDDPATINCYGVFVSGLTEQQAPHACLYRDSNAAVGFNFGPHIMAAPAGSELELSVPSGKQREIILVGMNAPENLCRDFKNGIPFHQITFPRVLAQTTVDLSPGFTSINLRIPEEISNLPELGSCSNFSFSDLPTNPPPTESGWKSVSGADLHTCGIRHDGRVFCWGRGINGQLGTGSTLDSSVPTPLTTTDGWDQTAWKSVSAGGQHTCGIRQDDRMFCWGLGIDGQLGTGSTSISLVPVALNSVDSWDQTAWKSVSAGSRHSCGIRKSDDQIFCWGSGISGRLGTGDTTDRDIPTPLGGGMAVTTWKNVSVGFEHTCGIRASDDQIFCWGRGIGGGLGTGSTSNSLVPVALNSVDSWVQVATGGDHTCGIRNDGQMFCWGYGVNGQLGTGSTSNSLVPVALNSSGGWDYTEWKSVSAGALHTCGVRASDDRVFCWGNGIVGRLGTGDEISTNATPRALTSVDGWNEMPWESINTGQAHTCAIRNDSQMFCWGLGTSGQLGNGSDSNSFIPQPVSSPITGP